MSDDQDDDFWTTYIATTPEQDKDFAPFGRWLIVGALIAVAIAAVAAMLLHG